MLKIEISINAEIIIFIIILILAKKIWLYTLFILFVLLHELTHIIVAVALGFKPKKLSIMPFGFKMEFNEIKNNKNIKLKKIAVAAAGPTINLLIVGIANIFKLHINIIYINLIIALFNLIPIYPLDGGRILKSILNIKFEYNKAYKIVNIVSNLCIIALTAFCSVLVLRFKNISIIFVLAYLWYLVIRENKRYKIIKRVYRMIEKTDN